MEQVHNGGEKDRIHSFEEIPYCSVNWTFVLQWLTPKNGQQFKMLYTVGHSDVKILIHLVSIMQAGNQNVTRLHRSDCKEKHISFIFFHSDGFRYLTELSVVFCSTQNWWHSWILPHKRELRTKFNTFMNNLLPSSTPTHCTSKHTPLDESNITLQWKGVKIQYHCAWRPPYRHAHRRLHTSIF